ncbi:hypothetical protein V7128_08325 [Neobacillus vireti]|uniref:hypothetical protein n=1 Tax=Neobacillus vireti TaxID=220686 RepID=UPI002FFFEF2E
MADFLDEQDAKKQDQSEEQSKEDRFTSLMFGSRQHNHSHKSQHRSEPQQQNHATIDYEELMMNIDTLLDSVRGLKPLFSKVYPYIEQIWKKK